MMMGMTPLTGEGKPLDVSARLVELTGLVESAARDGLPAHELEHGLWQSLLRLGHELQAEYFALAGDGDRGGADAGRRPCSQAVAGGHIRPYQSILATSPWRGWVRHAGRPADRGGAAGCPPGITTRRVFVSAAKLESGLGGGNPYGQVNTVLGRILGLKQSVASLEAMTRTLAGAVGHEAARRRRPRRWTSRSWC